MATLTIDSLEALLGGLGLKIPLPHFSAADVLTKPLDVGRTYLADILCSLVECDAENAYRSIQWPGDIYNGDLAVILPKLSHGANPDDLALDLMKKVCIISHSMLLFRPRNQRPTDTISQFPKCPLFILPFAEGVHLRIMFMQQTLPRLLLPYINERKETYGRDVSPGLRDPAAPEVGRQKLVIEFSSPNLASEFQGKHLRSTILGACIGNLHQSMGWDVVRINYLGDWGKPIGLLGVGWEKFGSEELFLANPAGHLLDVYNKINDLFLPEQAASKRARDKGGDTADIESHGLFAERNSFFKRMEDGEEKAIALWKRVWEVGIESYTKFYDQLNVKFDEYTGESQVDRQTMVEVEEILKIKGLCEESGGAWTIDLKKHGAKSGMAIIRDRTGASTYLLRDLAAVLDRSRKYNFDKMIYVVAADQHTTHFSRLFKILKLMDMPDLASKLQHVSFNESAKMSKNLGHGHMLGEILQPYRNAMHDSLKEQQEKASIFGETDETAAALGITALLTLELSTRRANDHAFEISQVTSFDPGTGPDLQYWYARLYSALKANPEPADLSDEEFASLVEENQTNLLRLLIQYPDVTQGAYKSFESAPVLAYLVHVTAQLSLCMGESQEEIVATPAQVMLYETARTVLENGMKLLGIRPSVER